MEPRTATDAAGGARGTGRGPIVGIALLAAALGAAAVGGWRLFATASSEGDATVVHPTADVVVAVQDLARLETASYHIERVIDLSDRQERLFGLVHAADAILLVAAGEVSAGIDLAELRPTDVAIDAKHHRARLVLPPPRLLHTRLDNDRTYVHTRTTDTLARRREDLETRARQEAERTLAAAALQGGILARAKTNAARVVETLVRSLGYDEVVVTWREE